MRHDCRGRLGVDVRKSLKIAFGVARRHTAHAGGGIACPGTIPRDQALRLSIRREPEVVRVLLRPFQPAFVTIDAQTQCIFVPGGDLAGPKHAART